MLAAARTDGQPQIVAPAIAAAAQLQLARGNQEEARAILAELDQQPGVRGEPTYASRLPCLVRSALGLRDQELAARLVDGVEPLVPVSDHALTSCRAELAEATGNRAEAARIYADAAHRWQQFGNVPERAHALLGQGRCLHALGDPTAEAPLAEARELFASMGYRPALAETDALLAGSQPAAS